MAETEDRLTTIPAGDRGSCTGAISLAELARAAAYGIRAELPARVRLDTRIDESATARVGGSALETALHELLRNACDALRRSGGVLTLAAGRPQPPFPHDLPDGGWVCIAIGDTGMGMDPFTLQRLRQDRDSDGGFARAREAIDRVGGVLDVNSWPGGGTVVRAYLPGG